jgi:hypothetical protein
MSEHCTDLTSWQWLCRPECTEDGRIKGRCPARSDYLHWLCGDLILAVPDHDLDDLIISRLKEAAAEEHDCRWLPVFADKGERERQPEGVAILRSGRHTGSHRQGDQGLCSAPQTSSGRQCHPPAGLRFPTAR